MTPDRREAKDLVAGAVRKDGLPSLGQLAPRHERPPPKGNAPPGTMSSALRSRINQQGPHSTQSDYPLPVRLARARQLRIAMLLSRATQSQAARETAPPPVVVATGRTSNGWLTARHMRPAGVGRYVRRGCRPVAHQLLTPERR